VGHSAPHCTINQTNLEIWTWPYRRRCYNSCSGLVLYSDSLPPSPSPHPTPTAQAMQQAQATPQQQPLVAQHMTQSQPMDCGASFIPQFITSFLISIFGEHNLPVEFSSLHLICRWAQHDSAHYIQYAYECCMTLLWE